jgi:hypothetical protein
MMTLNDFIHHSESRYAVITHDSYLTDPVAQSLTPSPRTFIYQSVEMVVISLEPLSVPQLVEYANQAANGVEFELTVGSGKVTLLTHSKILDILNQYE